MGETVLELLSLGSTIVLLITVFKYRKSEESLRLHMIEKDLKYLECMKIMHENTVKLKRTQQKLEAEVESLRETVQEKGLCK